MKVFISWSGEKSKAVAKVLRRRIPNILQAVEPYMSDQDIDKGDRWFQNLSEELNKALFGIVCLTPSNLTSEWISFEAGAIASKLEQSRVTALLIDLKKSNVSGPLAQFQLTEITESEFDQLMSSINKLLGENGLSEPRLSDQLEVFWPKIKSEIDRAVSEADQNLSEAQIQRSERDLLEEILDLSRQMARRSREGKEPHSEEEKSDSFYTRLPLSTVDRIRNAQVSVKSLTLDQMYTAYGSVEPEVGYILYVLRENGLEEACDILARTVETSEELKAALEGAKAATGWVRASSRKMQNL